MSDRILCVDDEQPVRALLERILVQGGHATEVAGTASEARAALAGGGVVLVLCDVNLDGESGLDLLRELAQLSPDVATMMVTGYDDPALAETALELGAFGYVTKPFGANELLIEVSNALRHRRLALENRAHKERLEEAVESRTRALREAIARLERSQEELRRSREETIRRLALAVESHDSETGAHIERMSRHCEVLAERVGMPPERVELIRLASSLHDLGKIAVPDEILQKPGPLTDDERATMQTHTLAGHAMLAGSGGDLLDLAALIALTHHERVDGSGYPNGARGADIPLEGRIAAVADVYDALLSDRPYRPRMAKEDAVGLLLEGRGTQFDAALVDLVLESQNGRGG